MYKRVETERECLLANGCSFRPVATLADGGGGRCQIAVDDGCYVLRLRSEDGTYRTTPYIFREAFEVLKTLPPPGGKPP
jgi:hypothetical protein